MKLVNHHDRAVFDCGDADLNVYGALALLDAPLSLVLPLAVAADALKRGEAAT